MNIAYLKYINKRYRISYLLLSLVYFASFSILMAFIRNENVHIIKTIFYIPISIFIIIAYLLPIFDYRVYFDKNSANVYFALPDRRANIYRTNIYYHLCANILIFVLNFLFAILILAINGIDLAYKHLFSFMGFSILIFIGVYFLSAFITTKCTNIYDAIVLNLLYMVLPAVFIFTMYAAFNLEVIEWSSISYIGAIQKLCKFYPQLAITNLDKGYGDWYIPVIMAGLGILLHILAVRENKNYKPEKIGDISDTRFGYRTIIPLFLLAIFLITNWKTGIVCLFVLIITILGYIIYVVLNKKKQFSYKKIVLILSLFFLANIIALIF